VVEVLDRVTMQVFVRGYCTMIAAPVQCDVDGIPKGSHSVSVPPMAYARRERDAKLLLTLITALTVHVEYCEEHFWFLTYQDVAPSVYQL
jgi:hypothetical protein